MTTTLKQLSRTEQELLLYGTSNAFGHDPLPAAGASQKTEIFNVGGTWDSKTGSIGIRARYIGGTGATTGAPQLKLWVSCADNEPAIGDSSWAPVMTPSTVSPTIEFAGAGSHVEFTMQPGIQRLAPDVAAGDTIPGWLTVEHEAARWLYIEACEVGDTAHPGKLSLFAVRS